MSPRSFSTTSKGRRTPGKPGRFDPTEPLHMTTRHAARNGRPNGSSQTDGSVDDNDSPRGSIDDFRPTTSQSLGSQTSSKGRRHSGHSTNGVSDANDGFDYQPPSENKLTKELRKVLTSGMQPASPTRKRKRSTPTPPGTPDDDVDVSTPQNELTYRDPRDTVEVIDPADLSDRETDGSVRSDDEPDPEDYGLTTQSTDATPAGSEPISPASDASQDQRFPPKLADVIMPDVDQQAEIEDPEDLDDAEDIGDAEGIEDADEVDDEADDQARADDDGKPRRRLAGRRRAEHHDPVVEATLRRQLQLKSAYRAIARALKPVLAEIALKTTERLDAEPFLHEQCVEYQGSEESAGIQELLDNMLAKRKAQLEAQLQWNRIQLQRTLHGEREVRKSRCKQQIEDLQQLQMDRLQHDVLTLARTVQVSNDNKGYDTEDEDEDIIPKPKGMGYRFQRLDALDSKYDSRSRLAMESERAVDDLKTRFEMQQMLQSVTLDDDEDDEEGPGSIGFTVMDDRARGAALARRECVVGADMLAEAAVETERLAAEEAAKAARRRKIKHIANKDAIGLQILGDLAARPSVSAMLPSQQYQLPPPPAPLPPPPSALPAPRPQQATSIRHHEQQHLFSPPSLHTSVGGPIPQRQPSILRPPIQFERRPHDPPPRTTAFPDAYSNPRPPPSLTVPAKHLPGHARRLTDPPRRIPDPSRRIPEPRVAESPRGVPESTRLVPESPRPPAGSPPRRPIDTLRNEPPPFLTPSGMRNRGGVQSLSLMPPTTSSLKRRESSPPAQVKRPELPATKTVGHRPQSSHQPGHKHQNSAGPEWESFRRPYDGSPRAPPYAKRSVHAFSGGHLSIERVEPVERQDGRGLKQDSGAYNQRDSNRGPAPLSMPLPPKPPPPQSEPPSMPVAQDSRPVRPQSPPAPLAELIRDNLAKLPRSRASSIISQSTANEASAEDTGMRDSQQRHLKGLKPHGLKSNKAERNGASRKQFKQKNNGPGPTIHRFRLGQTELTPTSTPTTASWHGSSGSYSAQPPDYSHHGYGAPSGAPPSYGPGYPQGFSQPYQQRHSLPQLAPGGSSWSSQPQSPPYAVPPGQQSRSGLPPPPDHWPPAPQYSGPLPGSDTPQTQNNTPGPQHAQFGGPPIAPATPDTRLMQAGTSRPTNHPPAFAQQQRKEEINPRRRTQSDVQGHKFQHYEPRRT